MATKTVDITEKDSKKETVLLGDNAKGKETVQVETARGPRVLAIVDDSKKSKLMVKELRDRKINFAERKADLKNVVKAVKDAIGEEKGRHDVVYLPITNDEYNKDAATFSQLRNEVQFPVNLYFQDRDEADIANRIFVNKIE